MKIESTIELFFEWDLVEEKLTENLEKEAKKSTHSCSFKKIASIWRENMHEYFSRGHYLFQDANSETVSFE